jgi:hypothetical protein
MITPPKTIPQCPNAPARNGNTTRLHMLSVPPKILFPDVGSPTCLGKRRQECPDAPERPDNPLVTPIASRTNLFSGVQRVESPRQPRKRRHLDNGVLLEINGHSVQVPLGLTRSDGRWLVMCFYSAGNQINDEAECLEWEKRRR